MANWKNNSGLGDYIHLHWANYQNQGIYRPQAKTGKINAKLTSSGPIQDTYETTYSQLKALVKTTIVKNARIKNLETFMTNMYRQNWHELEQGGYDVQDLKDLDQDMANAIIQEIPQFQFDRTNMTLVSNFQTVGDEKVRNYYRGVNKGGHATATVSQESLRKIQNRLKSHLAYAAKLLASGQLDEGNMRTLEQKQKEMEEYAALLTAASNSGRNRVAIRQGKTNRSKLNPLGECISAINRIRIQEGLPDKKAIGTVGEIGAAAMIMAADRKGRQGAEQIIKSVIGSSGRSANITFKSNNYYDRFVPINGKWKLEDGKYISTSETLDTVDIDLEVSDDIFGETQRFMASVKNYLDPTNPAWKGVSVISGVTLHTILSLLDTQFSNHYLNFLVQHEDYVSAPPKQAENLLKYAVAVRAITGARYKGFEKLSQYLIVYNRSKRRVNIWSSNYLLSQLSPSVGVFQNDYASFEGLPINQAHFANVKEITAAQRISKIIAQTHEEKISMSLTPSFFSKIPSGS